MRSFQRDETAEDVGKRDVEIQVLGSGTWPAGEHTAGLGGRNRVQAPSQARAMCLRSANNAPCRRPAGPLPSSGPAGSWPRRSPETQHRASPHPAPCAAAVTKEGSVRIHAPTLLLHFTVVHHLLLHALKTYLTAWQPSISFRISLFEIDGWKGRASYPVSCSFCCTWWFCRPGRANSKKFQSGPTRFHRG